MQGIDVGLALTLLIGALAVLAAVIVAALAWQVEEVRR